MFYCDKCAEKNNWNVGLFRVIEPCEMCNKVRECSSLSRKNLTNGSVFPKPKKSNKIISIWS